MLDECAANLGEKAHIIYHVLRWSGRFPARHWIFPVHVHTIHVKIIQNLSHTLRESVNGGWARRYLRKILRVFPASHRKHGFEASTTQRMLNVFHFVEPKERFLAIGL